MAKIILSHNLSLDVGDRIFKVTFRELSNKRVEELNDENKELLEAYDRSVELNENIQVSRARLLAFEALGDNSGVLAESATLGAFKKENKKINETFEELGGNESIDAHKIGLMREIISGDEAEDLIVWTLANSDLNTVLSLFREDIKKAKEGN